MGKISVHKFREDILWREAGKYISSAFERVLKKSPEELLPPPEVYVLASEGRVYGVKKKTVVFLSGGSAVRIYKNLESGIMNYESGKLLFAGRQTSQPRLTVA